MNLADILKEIGNEGQFQVVALLILAMPKMPFQWSMTMMSYAAYEPEWCCVPAHLTVDPHCELDNSSGLISADNLSYLSPSSSTTNSKSFRFPHNDCNLNSSSCAKRIFLDSDGASTAVTEWDLVCGQQWIVSSLSSVQMGGVMVGALACGSLADEFGRKRVHFATILAHALLNLGAGLSNSWVMFAVFRFLIGATIGGYLVVHVPYILEFVSPRWRVIPASLPFAAIGASLLPLAAWQLPDWRWMHFICALFCAPFLLGYCYLPESVRWLTVKGRVEEAAKVVAQIARINRKEYNAEKCFKKMQKIAQREQENMEKGRRYSYLDVYRDWKMAKLTLTLQYVWFTTSLVGYGIILGISTLAGNVYVNMFAVEVVEIPFIMATYYFSNCIGRRYTALVYFILATFSAFLAFTFHLLPYMPHRDMTITMMCISCRTFVAGAAAVFIVVSTEVYPTVIRTLGFGAANTAAKVGGVLAPFIINMDAIPSVSFAIMFVTCLFCVLAVLSLHETKNLDMEDTLQSAGSKSGLVTSSLSSSLDRKSNLRRALSQPRIIIDFDIDLIHQRSYSEFEDDNEDENDNVDENDDDNVKLVKRGRKRKRERFPLLQQRPLTYATCLSSSVDSAVNVNTSDVDSSVQGSSDTSVVISDLDSRGPNMQKSYQQLESKDEAETSFLQSLSSIPHTASIAGSTQADYVALTEIEMTDDSYSSANPGLGPCESNVQDTGNGVFQEDKEPNTGF